MKTFILVCGLVAAVCAHSVQAAAKEVPEASSGRSREATQWAIVAVDSAPLRAGPRDAAKVLTTLTQGETLELRGRQLDYVQVWDYQRERGGFVRATNVRELPQGPDGAASLVPVVGFLRDSVGQEALGVGLIANYLRLADAARLRSAEGAYMVESLGWMADRFARRVMQAGPGSRADHVLLTAQQDVLARYGVKFRSVEREGNVTLCYDGDAHRQVLGLPATTPTLASAVLSLTRAECADPAMTHEERWQLDQWRVELVDQLTRRPDYESLPVHLRQRIRLRTAVLSSSLAYQAARRGEASTAFAVLARDQLAGVTRSQLIDADTQEYERTALRLNASRFALLPNEFAPALSKGSKVRPEISRLPTGETCVALVEDVPKSGTREWVRRCTYGLVWENSLTRSPDGTAYVLAVQPLEAWRELWVADLVKGEWRIRVVPPGDILPGIGYAEFAGWVPGTRQLLLAREAQGGGRSVRNFSVIDLDTLEPRKQAQEPGHLTAFQRWPDAAWKRHTLALR